MSPDRVRLEILCEDRSHEQFARRLFTSGFGMSGKDLHFESAPSGRGSAAQWVVANYDRAVRRARTAKAQQRFGTLVMIDGDVEGVERRKRSLYEASSSSRDDLKLAIWVPTRNIETWVKYLSTPEPRPAIEWENVDFKNEVGRDWSALLDVAIGNWSGLSEATCEVESLKDALRELRHLPFQ